MACVPQRYGTRLACVRQVYGHRVGSIGVNRTALRRGSPADDARAVMVRLPTHPRRRAEPIAAGLVSEQPGRPEAGVTLLADDHVVMNRDVHSLQCLFDLPGHVDIGAGGRGIAGGVIVHEDDR